MIASACLGAVHIRLCDFFAIVAYRTGVNPQAHYQPQQEAVLFALRFPRVLLGVLVGAGLGISGASLQGLFRNPLADSGLIGISSGASLFAVMMIVLEATIFKQLQQATGYYALSLAAFAGACITTFAVYRISIQQGRSDVSVLLLGGIAINALAGALIGLMTYMATDEQLRNITFWNLGSLGGATWKSVTALSPFIAIPVVALPFLSKSLNAFALGEAQARHMGVNTGLVKRLVIVLATMAVGSSVAISGIIGFVGLIIPHIIRMAFGADHRLLIPASAILGAAVLTLADLVSRTIVAPAELPLGVITALLGAPVFIYIIMSRKRRTQL
ncbi:iron chelate uptake ABC transporter family permease subunit [Mucilaginibacter sp. HME9299]|uniref:Iron chelate uptake ABC transporter family permease subunit n=2 Tax=Mucilaginibacter aquatilis TaxID=1517760 RepID=A0A6I4I8I2_9SPHI|nr:iron chelate uptake ABC transporter family permease subunit [Mucilaginibacter aquatilis]